jgi:hypothetical protein
LEADGETVLMTVLVTGNCQLRRCAMTVEIHYCSV